MEGSEMGHLQELALWLRVRRSEMRDLADWCAENGQVDTAQKYYQVAHVLTDVLVEVRRRLAATLMEGNENELA